MKKLKSAIDETNAYEAKNSDADIEKSEHPQHEIDHAADTLMKAEQIKAHKTLFPAAMAKLGGDKKHITHLEGLGSKERITSIADLKKKEKSL